MLTGSALLALLLVVLFFILSSSLSSSFGATSISTVTMQTTEDENKDRSAGSILPLCTDPQHLGDQYGGWTICNGKNVTGGLVYTIGIGKNIEWDKAMISKFQTVHHGWDPTPSAKEFFEKQAPPQGFTFHPEGLGVKDGQVTVKLPVGNIDSYTIMNYDAETQNGKVVSISVLTLESMLRKNGHEKIDVLKIDAEGIEFDVIADWARRGYHPPAKEILVEFHERYFTSSNTPGGTDPTHLIPTAITQMNNLGFELLFKNHWEYTFVRRD